MKEYTIFFTKSSPTEVVNILAGCISKELSSTEMKGTTVLYHLATGGTLTLTLPEEVKSPELFKIYKEQLVKTFQSIETKHTGVREGIVEQVKYWNLCFQITIDNKVGDGTIEALETGLFNTIKYLGGFLLTQDYTLFDENREMILNGAGESDTYLFIPTIPPEEYLKHNNPPSPEDLARYQKNIAFLQEKDEQFQPQENQFALQDDEYQAKPIDTAVGRMLSLFTIANFTDTLMNPNGGPVEAQEVLHKLIQNYQLMPYLSEKETIYLNIENFTPALCTPFLWCYINVEVLAWALGFLENFGDLHQVYDVNQVAEILLGHQTKEDLVNASTLRPKEELLAMQDLMMKLHRYAMDLEKQNKPLPEELDVGIIIERHKTLNWLITSYYGNDWDKVVYPC